MEKKETKEKNEKKGMFGKSVLWTVLSYVGIYIVAILCWMIRGKVQGETNGITFWMILELFLIPALFAVMGYLGTVKWGLGKFKSGKVWLFAFLFSGIFLVLWYLLRDVYVLINLPVVEGTVVIDMFLRRVTLVRDYTVLFLSQTHGYKYGILPMIHFVMGIIYWLLYLWGNRMGVSKENYK